MKKTIIILSLLLASFGLSAQGGNSPISLGVQAGTNLFFPSGMDFGLSRAGNGQGVDVGVFGAYALNDALEVEVGASYQTRNFKNKIDLGFLSVPVERYSMSYVNVPVLLNVNLGGLKLAAGPNAGLLLNAKNTTYDYSDTGEELSSEVESVTEFFNRLDVGGNVALGLAMKNGLELDLRTNISLLDMLKEGTEGALEHNTLVTVGLRYRIIGKRDN